MDEPVGRPPDRLAVALTNHADAMRRYNHARDELSHAATALAETQRHLREFGVTVEFTFPPAKAHR